MGKLKAFGLFWYDFIIGDDPLVAVLIIAALAGTAGLSTHTTASWWLLPVIVTLALAATLARAVGKKKGD
ncbi:hypothetical protein [Catenulispora pinisilvae]|uniref:hypothetical protein n=1 Tax=Catenulispora pinisilvae TaxID=2705253 RepID=UPI00189162E3|nr:hypothetical protein [Catenulispora pinisilvae]